MRDKIVVGLCNFLLKFASKDYRDTLDGLIRYGELSAYRDMKEGLEPPVHLANEFYSVFKTKH